jgi:hypothetical protein
MVAGHLGVQAGLINKHQLADNSGGNCHTATH